MNYNHCILCEELLKTGEKELCEDCRDDIYGKKQEKLYKKNRNKFKKETEAKRIKLL